MTGHRRFHQRPGFSFPAKYLWWDDWLVIAIGWCAVAIDFFVLLWLAGLTLGLPIGNVR